MIPVFILKHANTSEINRERPHNKRIMESMGDFRNRVILFFMVDKIRLVRIRIGRDKRRDRSSFFWRYCYENGSIRDNIQ